MTDLSKDYPCDNFNGVEIVKNNGKYYVQREYMVTGYEADGTYNPCISTIWNTLSELDSYNYSYRFIKFRAFDTIHNAILFLINNPMEMCSFSSVYNPRVYVGSLEVVETETSIRENNTEYFI